MASIEQFQSWLEDQSSQERFFAGTFWFVFSTLADVELRRTLGLSPQPQAAMPLADSEITIEVRKRTGKLLKATFWYLPVAGQKLHIFFSLEKPSKVLRPMYKLLAKAKGKAHLFPIGQPLVRTCVRLVKRCSFEQTYVVRGVSYPSRPNEGGADISLRPGNATAFFQRLDDERRVLKTARLRAPVGDDLFSEFTVSRVGYFSFHRGAFAPLMKLILETLAPAMVASVKPFEKTMGRFVSFRFSEPFFTDRGNYHKVLEALSRLPRTSVALLHTNPYFHATLTNYEDGGEFDVFITGHSAIHVQGRGEASPASFLRLQDGFTELFRDATIALEEKPSKQALRNLLDGQV